MNRWMHLFALVLVLAGVSPFVVRADSTPWNGANVLDDPAWRAHFLGTYGVLSGAEPEIRATEREILREVIELMKVDTRAAAAMLEGQVTADSSASVDFILANLQFQNGALDAAMKRYEAALAKFPDFRRAHKNLGLLEVQKGNYAAAIVNLSRAIELGDRDGRSYGLLGYCYIHAEKYVAAEQAYRNAILQQPDTRDWKLGLARSLLAMQRHEEAAALFGELLAANPEDTAAWMLQANAFLGQDDPMAAAVNLEAVRMMGKADTRSLVLLGDIYMNAEMHDLARSAYLEVVERDKSRTQFRAASRAAGLLLRTRAYEDAGKILAAIGRTYQGKLSADEELELLTLQARLARARGESAEAAKMLEAIVARDGTRGDALLELASYQRSAGAPERALLLIERAERIEAFRYPALLEHAQLLVDEKDYGKAADVLRKALQIKSEPRVEQFLARVERAVRR